jgi:parvulin-like peptidyl-prolyl isomerase
MAGGTFRRWLREPLLHFLLAGLALFAGYRALNPDGGGREPSGRIEISDDDVQQLALAWRAQWQRPPTADEMRGLLDDRIREEILYREALALGLDKGDTIVKRRLAQKMAFLAEDISSLRDPSAAALRAWFDKNRERFAQPGRVSFRHLYFSPDRRGEQARAGATQALAALAGKPGNVRTAGLADKFMAQDYYVERDPEQVAEVFGVKFAQELVRLKPDRWQGPLESGLGWHLVFVEAIAPGRTPAFEEVEAAVKAEWIEAQRAEMRERAFDAMKARYEVVLPK